MGVVAVENEMYFSSLFSIPEMTARSNTTVKKNFICHFKTNLMVEFCFVPRKHSLKVSAKSVEKSIHGV
jgi:hypothetical protein